MRSDLKHPDGETSVGSEEKNALHNCVWREKFYYLDVARHKVEWAKVKHRTSIVEL